MPKTAILLEQSVIAALREALSIGDVYQYGLRGCRSDTREDELRAEVDRWQVALNSAEDMVNEISQIDEHDPRFYHPMIGKFSPFSAGIKRQQIHQATGLLEEATGRLQFARAALRKYLEGLQS